MSSSSIVMVIVMTLILAGPGRAVPAQEMKDAKLKKPRFEKTDLTLTDNKTGLVWTLNANVASRQFSWSGMYDGLHSIINKERYAGYSDWRVPTKEELLTLVDLVQIQGYDGKSPDKSIMAGLAALGFQNVQEVGYWSSSDNRYFAAEARIVDMTDGHAEFADKMLYFNLWPVRSIR